MNPIVTGMIISGWLSLISALGACAPVGQPNVSKGPLSNADTDTLLQTKVNPNSLKDMLRFTVSVNKRKWRIGRGGVASDIASARLRVENSSDQDIEIRGPGTFQLYRRFSKKPRDQFYSSSALPGSTTTSSTPFGQHMVRRTWIKCPKGGHLDLEIDLGALKWGREIGAESPNQDLIQVVSPGNYDLFFIFIVGKSLNVEIPESTEFRSNKVDITLE